MAFSDGDRQFACDFCANPDIKTLIWFNLQRGGNWNWNGFSNIKETFEESFTAANVSSSP